MTELLGRGSIYTLGKLAPAASALVVTPIVVRALGQTEYGRVGIAITVAQSVSVLVALGLPAAITRHALIESSGHRGATGLMWVGMALAILAAAPIAVTAPWWGALLFSPLGWFFALPVISSIGISWLALAQSLMRAQDRPVAFVCCGALMAIAPPVAGLAACAIYEPTGVTYVLALALTQTVVGCLAILAAHSASEIAMSVRDLRQAIRVGLPTVPHQMAMSAVGLAVVALATSSSGVAGGGRAQIAMLVGTVPLSILSAVNNAWAPFIYRASADTRAAVLAGSTLVLTRAMLLLAPIYAVLTPTIARIIVGDSLAHVVARASLVTAVALAPMTLYLANIHLVFVSGETKLLAVSTPIALAAASAVVWVVQNIATLEHQLGLSATTLLVPVFYTFMWGFGALLRRHAHQPNFDLRATVWLVLGVVAVFACVAMSPIIGIPLLLLLGAILGAALLAARIAPSFFSKHP